MKTPPKGKRFDVHSAKIQGLTNYLLASRKSKKTTQKSLKACQVKAQQLVNHKVTEEKQQAEKWLNSLRPGVNVTEHDSLQQLSLRERSLERVFFNHNAMMGCDLKNSHLRGARFKHCNLSGANFSGADLQDCLFEHVNLSGVNFQGCRLQGARFLDSNLFAVNFDDSLLHDAIIDSCSIRAPSLNNTSCKQLKLSNSHISHGLFDKTDLSYSDIQHTQFKQCTLSETHFDHTNMEDNQFIECDSDFSGPFFSNSQLNGIILSDCSFEQSDWTNARVHHSALTRVHLTSGIFDHTLFESVLMKEGTLKDCYSLDDGPTFSHCVLDHIRFEQTDWHKARFYNSDFVESRARDSETSDWIISHTRATDKASLS